jgi:hypothetical protein
VPVWAIAPQSVIVAPAPDAMISVSKPTEIWGWAWADGGVRQVDVSVNAGNWQVAQLEPTTGRAWQRFTVSWTPIECGAAMLSSRATGVNGQYQLASGRRNAIYSVPVTILSSSNRMGSEGW